MPPQKISSNPDCDDLIPADFADPTEKQPDPFYLYRPSELPPQLENDPEVFIGTGMGYLRRRGSLLLSGETGVGKSIMASQLAICLVLGRPFLEIPIRRTCRVLVMTSEHEDGAEVLWAHVQGLAAAMQLTADELATLDRDLAFAPVGRGFVSLDRVEAALAHHKAEVVILNPLQHFADGHLSELSTGTALIQRLGTLITKCGVAVVGIHHVTKQTGTSRSRPDNDRWAADHYGGLGLSTLFDFFRSGALLKSARGERGHGTLKFTKGADRLGLPEEQKDRIEVCWSKGQKTLPNGQSIKLLGWKVWEGAPPEPTAPRKLKGSDLRLAQVKEILRNHGSSLTTAEIVKAMKEHGAGSSTVRDDLKNWSHEGGPLVKSPARRGNRFALAAGAGDTVGDPTLAEAR